MFTSEQMEWLEQQFERCWPMLERAVKKMREPYGRDYVWAKISTGAAQLFPGIRSAIVAEISEREDGSRVVHTWLAGGDFDEVVSLAEAAEIPAMRAGCVGATFTGRPGFQKRIPKGYRLAAVVMRKDF